MADALMPPPDSIGDLVSIRPWTDAELDELLVHACRHYSTELREWFAEITEAGADDADLYIGLRRHWPHSRVFVGPDRTGKKLGYTLGTSGSNLQFWVGVWSGKNHLPTLGNQPLIDRIRSVMGIPVPADRPELAELEEPASAAEQDHGPMDEHEALRRALFGFIPRLEALCGSGATDAEILAIVGEWGTGRLTFPAPACPYAMTGGPNPRFFVGHGARQGNWPTGKPDLEGAMLAKAVRKLIGIPQPKTPPPAPARKSRKPRLAEVPS
jgi:hypothetical protein